MTWHKGFMPGTQFSYVKNDNRSVAGTHWNVLTIYSSRRGWIRSRMRCWLGISEVNGLSHSIMLFFFQCWMLSAINATHACSFALLKVMTLNNRCIGSEPWIAGRFAHQVHMFVISLLWYINSNYTVLLWGWNQVAVITCRVKFRWCLWKNKLSSGLQADCHLYDIVFGTCGPRNLVHSALCSWLRGAGHDLSVLYQIMSQMLK